MLLETVTGAGALEATAARGCSRRCAQPIELASGVGRRSRPASAWRSARRSDRGVEEFLRKADLAMYEAKRGGKRRARALRAAPRGRRRRSRSARQWFARDDEQRAEIEAVLADPDGITMVFQPIMDLRTGRIAGYESLSRFNREPRRDARPVVRPGAPLRARLRARGQGDRGRAGHARPARRAPT